MIDQTIPQLPKGFGQNSKNPMNLGNTLGAVIGLGGQLVQANQAKKAHKRSIALMDRQFDMSKEMWKTQNAYNTPMKQMERLKQAGLNPALMYGQGNTGNANNAPQPTYNDLKPYTSATEIAQSTASGIQMSLAGAQKELLKQQSINKATDTAYRVKDYDLASALNKANVKNILQQMNESKARESKIFQDIDESKSRVDLNDVNKRLAVANTKLAGAKLHLTNAQKQQVIIASGKIKQDINVQKRIEAEIQAGYGTNTMSTIGNALGLKPSEASTAGIVAGAVLVATPWGKLPKVYKWVKRLLVGKKVGFK